MFVNNKMLKDADKHIRAGVVGVEAKQAALSLFFKDDGIPKIKDVEKNLLYRLVEQTKAENIVGGGILDRGNLDFPFSYGKIC